MFDLLTLTSQVLANTHQLTDESSWRAFLKDIVLLAQTRAKETQTVLDDTLVNSVLFMLNSDTMFGYVYRLIAEQFQTPEILFESADEETIAEWVAEADNPDAVDPATIVLLVSQIISIINAIKTMKNR